ncbi:MAG: endonuclease domain-containing protein [Candidatus Peribacteraceae bacterium]|nr:endonuclease domain-containing protein [Candidatus Peribacteraceae bacterium]
MKEMAPYNLDLRSRSQELRRNQTEAESLLWSFLRRKQLDGFQWYRQKPLGNCIVDFYCPKRNLVVEADGAQHSTAEGREYDEERDAELKELGFKILRFSNQEILNNTKKVLDIIKDF